MLKTLGKQIKEFKAASIATPLFMLLEVLMETLVPFLMASIIDDGVNVPGGDIHHICVVGAWMIVAAAVGLFAGLMGGRYGAYASAGFAKNLRQAMYYNIQTFSFTNIDKYSTAGLVTRMTTDVTNVQNSYMMILRMGMRAPASMICAMAAGPHPSLPLSASWPPGPAPPGKNRSAPLFRPQTAAAGQWRRRYPPRQ